MTGVSAALAGFGWRPLGRRAEVVSGLDLTLAPGQITLLAGGSGAGKSTVLRAFAGVLGSSVPGEASGRITIDDAHIGLLLQNPADSLVATTLGREVAFGPENLGLPRDQIWRRVHESLERVGLQYDVERPTNALSGGELQRLALAGVLAITPGLLLLDEPTSMLDDATAAHVRKYIVRVARETGATTVVVEHRIGPWLPHCDRVVVLDRGQLIADTDPHSFIADQHDAMMSAGVWMPGAPDPAPVDVPEDWVRPVRRGPTLTADSLSVELVMRTLRGSIRHRALRDTSAILESGALTALTGPSGAGKSTLLAALAGLLRPSGGSVSGATPPLDRRASRSLAQIAGFVPQNPEHGFLTHRVRDEIELTARLVGRSVETEGLLDLMRLSHLADANPFQLSGGEQRRLAVLAGLAHRPELVLLDEPTVGQDRHTWAAVTGWVTSARASAATVGVATHDASLIALADSVIHLDDGRSAS
ncbi:ABC transporter ATP-binding protein [Rudaeicoccus suwonensis]|uniref:Energy-coupling factor transport system ATP-binding protein n=1 Tax=Rudaeicoccus suwonensis TaxID=657409 RepID=A0A561EBF9_9MICO|nr:ATP-binding cassette domain-containing protein [Rudaeicoccus suwonensis]TWE12953.1 energy-coupling factor transport system ATP-binding protein [Rudaeicoccus suwonensis]